MSIFDKNINRTIKQLFDYLNTSKSGAIDLDEFENHWT